MLEKLKNVYKVQLAMLCALTGLFFIGDLNYKNLIAIITFGVILIMSLSFFDNKKDNNYFKYLFKSTSANKCPSLILPRQS